MSNFELNNEQTSLLIFALNLFISNNIEGISVERKQIKNDLAISAGKKLSAHQNNFNAEDIKIMVSSLRYFESVIEGTSSVSEEFKLDQATSKYLSLIKDIMDIIESALNSQGYSLYPE
ncbi:hypothetical protein CACET_c32130 [Clostridium aceticum]|uniref:Uncharacterized protein n=1 Tax=Clostridium aceticum TaxID=84022 RepID=A0A0D8I6K1_9CLOT|nr:hypothetical protein [Clostridium aceticum]AKL96657.1 hypothetical protein CACET_c32130 [Clostridium aceticum]KJF25905.1 hypothetical protein TZ02_16095 [Clostridium aceticum]